MVSATDPNVERALWQRATPLGGGELAHPRYDTVNKLFGSWSAGVRAAGLEPRRSGSRRRWSAEAIVAALTADAERRGRTPRAGEWKRAQAPGVDTVPHPTAALVLSVFGSWANAVRAAGLEPAPQPRRTPRWSAEQVIAAFQQFAAEHRGRAPTVREWKRAGLGPSRDATGRHFGSWSAAIRAAGLEPRREGAARRWTVAQVSTAIPKWAAAHGRPPRPTDWTTADPDGAGGVGHPCAITVRRYFGSWHSALQAAGFSYAI